MRGAADVHVLDETQLGVVAPCELEQSLELVVIEAASDHRVELESRKPRRARRHDALEHPGELIAPGQPQKPIAVQRVERDGDALEARLSERERVLGEQHAVGGHGELSEGLARKQLHQHRELAPHEGLAAGETNLRHPKRNEAIDQRADLLEGKDVLRGQPRVFLFGHAVRAAQVAAIGD